MQYEILKFTLLWKHGEPLVARGWFLEASHRSRHSHVPGDMEWCTAAFTLQERTACPAVRSVTDSFQLLAPPGSIPALEQRSDFSWDNDWARWCCKGLAVAGLYQPLNSWFCSGVFIGLIETVRSAQWIESSLPDSAFALFLSQVLLPIYFLYF